jgi:hypothetical protein
MYLLLYPLITGALGALAVFMMVVTHAERYFAFAFLIMLLQALIMVWAIKGTFDSAARHVRRGGRRASVKFVCIVLFLISIAGVYGLSKAAQLLFAFIAFPHYGT